MKNKTFSQAKQLLKSIFFNLRGEVSSPTENNPPETREPDKIKRVKIGKTVFVVGTFFNNESTVTLKDILERSIKREVCGGLNH